MEESTSSDEVAPETARKLPTVPRVPKVLGELFAVAHEGGEVSTAELGRMFGLNPRTVRKAIAGVADEDLRSIRRVFGMLSWVKGQQILDGIQDELIRRIEAGELQLKDSKGRYLEGFASLIMAQAAQLDRKQNLATEAGMAAGVNEDGGARTAIGKFLATLDDANSALRALPQGSRARVQVVTAELETGGGQPASVDVGSAEVVD